MLVLFAALLLLLQQFSTALAEYRNLLFKCLPCLLAHVGCADWCSVVACLARMLCWPEGLRWHAGSLLTWPWHRLTFPHSLSSNLDSASARLVWQVFNLLFSRSICGWPILPPTTHEATNHKDRICLESKKHDNYLEGCQFPAELEPTRNPLTFCSWVDFVPDALEMCTQHRRRGWYLPNLY